MEAPVILPPHSTFGPAASRKAVCIVRRMGQVPYREAWSLQQALVAKRKAQQIPDTLLLLEHPSVITMGRNGKPEHLLTPAEALAAQGVEVVETDRGGETTYHGPGQLVGYPIFDLGGIRKDVVWYVRTLEEVLIRTAKDFGIEAGRVAGCTGVWVNGAKLASIGIHISRWVTSHGFALNLDTDLSYFRHIVPCGIASCRIASFRELLGTPVDRFRVEEKIAEHAGDLFGLAMEFGQPEALKGESLAS